MGDVEVPVDVSQMTLLAAGAGEPVVDAKTKQQRVDRRTGALRFVLPVLAMRPGAAPELWKVKFHGTEPQAVPGSVVVLEGLTVTDYAIPDDRGGIRSAGLSFRAAAVTSPATSVKAG